MLQGERDRTMHFYTAEKPVFYLVTLVQIDRSPLFEYILQRKGRILKQDH